MDGEPLGERNSKWLQNDYVKFIRFGQWRIEKTGSGVLAFITDNSYLDSVTMRGMRQSLMETFTDIYILDLHGNSNKRETAPDGSSDINVFDIRQGVSIVFFVKELDANHLANVYHLDLFGKRQTKYDWLNANQIEATDWQTLKPLSPYYFFIPRDNSLKPEYEKGWKITDVLIEHATGYQSHNDSNGAALGFSKEGLFKGASDYLGAEPDEVEWEKYAVEVDYRPFDKRYGYFSSEVSSRPRLNIMRHLFKTNIALNITRQTKLDFWQHALVSQNPTPAVYVEIKDGSSAFPLYLYPEKKTGQLFELEDDGSMWQLSEKGRRPNLSSEFVKVFAETLGLDFITEGQGQIYATPIPSSKHQGGGQDDASETLKSPPNALGGDLEGGQDGTATGALEVQHNQGWISTHTLPSHYKNTKQYAREMRKEPTPAENQLWQQLRKRQVQDIKFRRQHTVGPFIVDFYAADARLVIEVDGMIHEKQKEYDAERQAYLEGLGLRVLRFTNGEVVKSLDAVVERIGDVLHEMASPETSQRGTFGPEDVFHYAYAVFHSPTYRERYAEFLKIDFPRLPLTSDVGLFKVLCEYGEQLVQWHLMKHDDIGDTDVTFPVSGSGEVASRHPRYEEKEKRVYINGEQYFANISQSVWDFHIGGYQVLQKWLKDRKGRTLSFNDVKHYEQIVKALQETMRLMDKIDDAIPSFPIE